MDEITYYEESAEFGQEDFEKVQKLIEEGKLSFSVVMSEGKLEYINLGRSAVSRALPTLEKLELIKNYTKEKLEE